MPDPQDLPEDKTQEYLDRLTLHAIKKLKRLRWRGAFLSAGGSIPGGNEAADFAANAIVDYLRGQRVWNKEKYPDVLSFLKGAVDSMIGHMARSRENKTTRRFIEGEGRILEPAASGSTQVESGDPEATQQVLSEVMRLVADDPVAKKVVECLANDITKPSEIAILLDVEVSIVNNAQKRLRRAMEKAEKTIEKERAHGRARATR